MIKEKECTAVNKYLIAVRAVTCGIHVLIISYKWYLILNNSSQWDLFLPFSNHLHFPHYHPPPCENTKNLLKVSMCPQIPTCQHESLHLKISMHRTAELAEGQWPCQDSTPSPAMTLQLPYNTSPPLIGTVSLLSSEWMWVLVISTHLWYSGIPFVLKFYKCISPKVRFSWMKEYHS